MSSRIQRTFFYLVFVSFASNLNAAPNGGNPSVADSMRAITNEVKTVCVVALTPNLFSTPYADSIHGVSDAGSMLGDGNYFFGENNPEPPPTPVSARWFSFSAWKPAAEPIQATRTTLKVARVEGQIVISLLGEVGSDGKVGPADKKLIHALGREFDVYGDYFDRGSRWVAAVESTKLIKILDECLFVHGYRINYLRRPLLRETGLDRPFGFKPGLSERIGGAAGAITDIEEQLRRHQLEVGRLQGLLYGAAGEAQFGKARSAFVAASRSADLLPVFLETLKRIKVEGRGEILTTDGPTDLVGPQVRWSVRDILEMVPDLNTLVEDGFKIHGRELDDVDPSTLLIESINQRTVIRVSGTHIPARGRMGPANRKLIEALQKKYNIQGTYPWELDVWFAYLPLAFGDLNKVVDQVVHEHHFKLRIAYDREGGVK